MQPDTNELFSVPCRPGILRTLQDCLRPHSSAHCDISFPAFHVDLEPSSAAIESEGVADAASFGEAVRATLFFHVVRGSPNSMVRVTVDGESGFDAADVIIAPHRTLHVNGHSREVIVDSAALEWLNHSEKQVFVLSLVSFSCEELAAICKWKRAEKLGYGFWGVAEAAQLKIPASAKHVLPQLLQELLPSTPEQGLKVDVREPGVHEWRACLSAMTDVGLVQKLSEDERFSMWCLTEQGVAGVKVGSLLEQPSYAMAIRDGVDLAERTVWELLLLLDQDGWKHAVKDKGDQDCYRPGSDKVWYSRPGDDTISFWYLLCLAQGNSEVPHFQSSGFYQALAGGKAPPIRRQRKAWQALRNVADDDWDAPAVADAVPAKRARRKRAPVHRAVQDALEADMDHAPVDLQEDEEGHSDCDDIDQQLLAAFDELDGTLNPGSVASNNSATSNSSSKSSGSSSSSSSSDSTGSSGETEDADADAPAGAGARAVNPKASFYYGMGHAVRVYKKCVAVGWEMACAHPLHTSKKCRKNLKEVTRSRSSAETLQCLKVWIIRGRHVATAEEHMAETWSELQRDFSLGQLEAAPEDPPMQCTGADGRVHTFTRPTR